ncbi:transcriptional regulator GcvA [Nisaea acidiphila]|uniref:Transcriptional regulator GcvA n=1 Tax=Nisaea acidiphila TaxID=1862145 RepID=A0A9J7ATZ2_9PROT|nr:transcriptional regulator GcvA [Nisaea acidiphila]UUX50298.1 transcriptional regulator GcvA [Nisaea acidiphila]
MLSRLPLNGLRCFEAAARHMSFKLAAAELFVTPAAVSQQIKALETELGCPLFLRRPRALELTPEGMRLAPVVRDAFSRLLAAVNDLKEQEEGRPLTVSVLPSFAVKWLIPRLSRFRMRYPEIDVRIAAEDRRADFVTDGVDVALRLGDGNYEGLHVEKIMSERIYPVCSPEVAARPPGLRKPEDLKHYPLLHDVNTFAGESWDNFLQQFGIEGIDLRRGAFFTQMDMVLQAAVEGQGVALARSQLVTDDLRAGRLIRPFENEMPAPLAYYFVCREDALRSNKVSVFRDWVLDEVRRDGILDEPE